MASMTQSRAFVAQPLAATRRVAARKVRRIAQMRA